MRSVSRKKISVTLGITCSALRIPVPMGPNPGRWSYGVVAVLDERYGISNHPVTTVLLYPLDNRMLGFWVLKL